MPAPVEQPSRCVSMLQAPSHPSAHRAFARGWRPGDHHPNHSPGGFRVAAGGRADPREARRSVGDDQVVPGADVKEAGGRWRPFETKAQRGRFLVILGALVLVGVPWLSNWSAQGADRAAAVRAEEIRTSLSGHTPEALRMAGISADQGLPGGPYRMASLDEVFTASAEVTSRGEVRCIRVRVEPDGAVSTEIQRREC